MTPAIAVKLRDAKARVLRWKSRLRYLRKAERQAAREWRQATKALNSAEALQAAAQRALREIQINC